MDEVAEFREWLNYKRMMTVKPEDVVMKSSSFVDVPEPPKMSEKSESLGRAHEPQTPPSVGSVSKRLAAFEVIRWLKAAKVVCVACTIAVVLVGALSGWYPKYGIGFAVAGVVYPVYMLWVFEREFKRLSGLYGGGSRGGV